MGLFGLLSKQEFDQGLRRVAFEIKEFIMATAEELVQAFDEATNEVASDLQDARAEITALLGQLGNVDAEKEAAVQEALAKFDAPLARLQALGADPENPVPAPEPTPEPAPAPEEPSA